MAVKLNIPAGDFDGFIFDCDGTLVDSMPLHHRAWIAALKAHGGAFEFDWDLFMSRAGMGMRDTVVELNRQFNMQMDPDRVVEAQSQNYAALLPELRPIGAVVDFAAAHRHKKLSVASGGDKVLVTRGLEHVGIASWFTPILCRADVTRGKPDPEMFQRCAELMGVAPECCLVFEDGELGMRAAERARMRWVAVDGTGRNSG